jgi:hypothetical protein
MIGLLFNRLLKIRQEIILNLKYLKKIPLIEIPTNHLITLTKLNQTISHY